MLAAALIAATCLGVAVLAGVRYSDRLLAWVYATQNKPKVEGLTAGVTSSGSFSSRFLNTRPHAEYTGSTVCRDCHEEEHESFAHTGMARSMAAVDLAREPPDASFEHEPSQRRYEVLRRQGRMWHREWRTGETADDVLLQEHPVAYVTGSGRHSLTYVVETEGGFFVESPITWYAARQAWGMSPGYDRPEHSSFQREVGQECLVCHAGRVEALGGSYHRMRVIEEAIGCERCHGPGSLHVRKHHGEGQKSEEANGPIDYTIVNPSHLPRKLAEAVCQQCHLRLSATVLLSGRRLDDFRPGLPLEAFRQDYNLASKDAPMTVVGHVEQMHNSACYRGSTSFTCTTCHSPHGEPEPAERNGYYQAVCLSCHKPEHCTVDQERRARESADNNCLVCHMPTTPTEIPHLAFTHHRVGIHDTTAGARAGETDAPAQLQPYFDDSHLPAAERQRALGLAYLELAIGETHPGRRAVFQREARRILLPVYDTGPDDGRVAAALASLDFELGLGGHGPLAERALADPRVESLPRANAHFLLAEWQFQQGQYEEARRSLAPLAGLRRHSLQSLLRAECEKRLGHAAGVKAALHEAVSIDPGLKDAHKYLAETYLREGDEERARWHQQRAK